MQPKKPTKKPKSPKDKKTQRPSGKPKANRAPVARGVTLPETLIAAWRAAILAQAKLPRGKAYGLSADDRLAAVIRQERSAVTSLWEIFTQERSELRRQLLSGRREAVAYLLGFHLANAARMQLLLERLDERFALSEHLSKLPGTLRVQDLGSGTGAMSLALTAYAVAHGIDPKKFTLNLSDASGTLLDAARDGFERSGFNIQLLTHKITLEQLPVERFTHDNDPNITSIYTLGYVWNETSRNNAARAKLRRLWQGHVERNEKALLLLVEPATQTFSRDAMTLRDELVTANYKPLYPCPHAEPCPMLTRARDWCYSEGLWSRPKSAEVIDRGIGVDRSRISGSLHALATPAFIEGLTARKEIQAVVVGRPEHVRPSKDAPYDFDYLLCQNTGSLGKATPPKSAAPLLRGILYRKAPTRT